MKKIATLSIIEDTKNKRYIMIRHHRGINEGFLNFPGGKKEEGETITDCVCRETYEESGLIIKNPTSAISARMTPTASDTLADRYDETRTENIIENPATARGCFINVYHTLQVLFKKHR